MAFKHGTHYGYQRKGCKCHECRAFWSVYQKGYRARVMAETNTVFWGSRGGFVPAKECACGCGERLPVASPRNYKRGHRLNRKG